MKMYHTMRTDRTMSISRFPRRYLHYATFDIRLEHVLYVDTATSVKIKLWEVEDEDVS